MLKRTPHIRHHRISRQRLGAGRSSPRPPSSPRSTRGPSVAHVRYISARTTSGDLPSAIWSTQRQRSFSRVGGPPGWARPRRRSTGHGSTLLQRVTGIFEPLRCPGRWWSSRAPGQTLPALVPGGRSRGRRARGPRDRSRAWPPAWRAIGDRARRLRTPHRPTSRCCTRRSFSTSPARWATRSTSSCRGPGLSAAVGRRVPDHLRRDRRELIAADRKCDRRSCSSTAASWI